MNSAFIQEDLNILNFNPLIIKDLVDYKGRFILILKDGNFLTIGDKICHNFPDLIVQFGPIGKYLLGLSVSGNVYILHPKKRDCKWRAEKFFPCKSLKLVTLMISSAYRDFIWIKTVDNSYLLNKNLECVFKLGFPQNRVYGADLQHYAIIDTDKSVITVYPSGNIFTEVSHITINQQNQINLVSSTSDVDHVELIKNQTYYFF